MFCAPSRLKTTGWSSATTLTVNVRVQVCASAAGAARKDAKKAAINTAVARKTAQHDFA
jgi:hypothetical protein